MNCNETREFLEEYLQDELENEKAAEVKAHLEGCSSCREEYKALKDTRDKIKESYQCITIPGELQAVKVEGNKRKFVSGLKINKLFSMKKITRRAVIAATCIIALLAGILIPTDLFFPRTVKAEEFRNGYSLVPEKSDPTGVLPDSGFLFKSQKNIGLEELTAKLVIDGEPAPVIKSAGFNTFRVIPSRKLDNNKLYTFKIKEDGEDITWTFQTAAPFRIVSVFPADKVVNVPVNTGIEIYFSHEEYENIDSYFEITPAVKGSFERHKKAAVFVPEKLKPGTLYTVTVKKGLKLEGTEYSLKEDYVFRFETGSSQSDLNNDKGNFSYNKLMYEYASGEKLMLPLNYWINADKVKNTAVTVKTNIYSYKDITSFTSALQKKFSVPLWASLSYSKNYAVSDGLNKVTAFDSRLARNSGSDPMLEVPQALNPGYYLVDSTWNDIRFQCFLQVTDIGVYVTETGNGTLFWLNDLKSGKPLNGADVVLQGGKTKFAADSNGVVEIKSNFYNNSDSSGNLNENQWYTITAKDGRSAVISRQISNTGYYEGGSLAGTYWNILQTDRSLYKPDDELYYWGMLKNRYTAEEIKEITIEINQGYRYYDYSFRGSKVGSSLAGWYSPVNDQPLVKETVSVTDGIFKGKLKLPNLEPGGYNLSLYKDGEAVSSSFLSIEDYIKPAYQLSIKKDKEALFLGESINQEITAAFFEGTGAPGLNVRYDIYNSIGGHSVSSQSTTNSEGKISLKYTPETNSSAQGEASLNISCSALLPETGQISENSSFRVFVNDINVDISPGDGKGGSGLTAKVNKIVLDRLNNGSAKDESDYLGAPVANKTFTGTLFKHTPIRIEDGTYYDFINKVTQKRYRYTDRKTAVKPVSITTGSDGKAYFTFTEKAERDSYYSVELTCTDTKSRSMKFEQYIGSSYKSPDYYFDNKRYWLDGGRETYKLGEKVELTYKKGLTPIETGKFLFIKLQNGLRKYELSEKPNYSFVFKEEDIPNMYAAGVYFSGKTYVQSEIFNAVYDYSGEKLVLEARTDRKAYKPGEEAVIKVTAKDLKGRPRKAVVNISLVDEALLKLSGGNTEMMELLYRRVGEGVYLSYITHSNNRYSFVRAGSIPYRSGNIKGSFSTIDNMFNKQNAAAVDETKAESGGGVIRGSFKDTAHFETINLDENGTGVIKFKLPDNVTSWRVALAGVTSDLKAGSGITSLNVSLPFFLNTSLNSTYLTGDRPELGVNAYGSGLKEGEAVTFEVKSTSNPALTASATGKAFERVIIPLWKLKEGKDDIIVSAKSAGGLKDAVRLPVTVINSYLQQQQTDYYNLVPGIKIKGGEKGNTKLVFSDKSKGRYFPELAGMLYTAGNRIDQRMAVVESANLLRKYFKQDIPEMKDSLKLSDYQREDGGFAFLPYGSSDADVTSILATLVRDRVDKARLKQYYYDLLWYGNKGIQGSALYGLAALKEPVLIDIDKAAKVENAGINDLIYLALAYCELGELPKADKLYNEKILKHIEETKPYFRIDTGVDNDDMLKASALAAVLASKLNKPEKEGLYQYCTTNSTKDVLILSERLLYITNELKSSKAKQVSFSYNYDGETNSIKLTKGETYTISIPSEKLGDFTIKAVNGNVSLASTYYRGLDASALDKYLTIDKKFYTYTGQATTSFKNNDIVKVCINWDIAAKALDGQYEISDYAPSGLKPIDNPETMGVHTDSRGSCYRLIDGQKVTFYVNKAWDTNKTLTYYARVVTPGTFKAESAVIQSVSSHEKLNIGKEAVITIK